MSFGMPFKNVSAGTQSRVLRKLMTNSSHSAVSHPNTAHDLFITLCPVRVDLVGRHG